MPTIQQYWAAMTPKQRSAEMKRRMKRGRERRLRNAATTESPFPVSSNPTKTASGRTLRNLVHDLETVVEELKSVFEF